jgi:hypothetical protein
MSDDKGGKSAADANAESGDAGTQGEKITVDRTPEEYARRLIEVSAENKKFRDRTKTAQAEHDKALAELTALREERAKEQGQYKSMYDELKVKYESESQQRKKDRAAYAYQTVTSQFAAEAAKAGCTRVEDLIKLAAADGLISELQASEDDFSVTQDSLKSALEKAQKQYSYLYARSTPGVRDGVPNTKQSQAATKDLTGKSVDELIAMARTLQS